MVLLDQDNRLLTGSADSELRAWDITYLQEVSINISHSSWLNVVFKQSVFLFLSVSLPPAQVKGEGEPEVKKGKTELEEDDDEEDKEGTDEIPEEVQVMSFLIIIWNIYV